MRRYLILTVAAIAAVGLVQPVAGAKPTASALNPAQAEAVRLARESGQSVEVVDQTHGDAAGFANPNGTFTLTSNRQTVPPKKGVRRLIDTKLGPTLMARGRRGATTMDVAFSGGGSGPVVIIGNGGGAPAFDWPARFPPDGLR